MIFTEVVAHENDHFVNALHPNIELSFQEIVLLIRGSMGKILLLGCKSHYLSVKNSLLTFAFTYVGIVD